MNRIRAWTGVVILAVAALVLLFGADASRVEQDRLGRFRNLGKAFYENPTTQPQAVDEFKKALDLAPNSAPEHVNYRLAPDLPASGASAISAKPFTRPPPPSRRPSTSSKRRSTWRPIRPANT